MRHSIPKFLFFLPSLLYYALIFFLSSKSYQVEVDILLFDKMVHLVEFAVLGFLLSLGFFVFNASSRKNFIRVFSMGALLAMLDEVHQFFVPLRTTEVFDLVADVIGIGIGFIVFAYFYKKKKWFHF